VPIVPIERALEPIIITRTYAADIICEDLYNAFIERVGTPDVTIKIQAGYTTVDRKWHGHSIYIVPVDRRRLSDLLPESILECQVRCSYTYGKYGFNPNEKLMRVTFVMQTLDIWERMLDNLGDGTTKSNEKTRQLLTDSIAMMTGTYSLSEMLPGKFTLEEFHKYFNPSPQLTDGDHHNNNNADDSFAV
jgi:hypothetical protein